MSKTLKVTIEHDDKIMILEGEEVEKWGRHCASVGSIASIHNMNPFDTDPVKWTIIKK